MDLRGLGAFLSALGGVFSAKAGGVAGQLQGLLMGEDITERRKRMKMTEEAQELQKRLAEAEETRRSELHPLQKALIQQQYEQQGELFPLQKEVFATQAETGKLNLTNARLWSMYQRGVAPSQISDPVLRGEYEPFFRYMNTVNSLQGVQTNEDLQALLGQVSEEMRPTLEILGRAQLFSNQSRREITEKQMKGLDLNIAQGEFQLRTAKLNTALNTILTNINNEGMDWDKRTPEQKMQAVKKWLSGLGLDDVVSEDFANMFQRVKSVDARQFALFRAQAQLNYTYNSRLLGQQIAGNLAIQRENLWGNLVFGALGGGQGQQGVGGVAPVGFPALPPIPNIFNNTYDNRGSNLNTTALNNYLKSAPFEISVPVRVGNQTVYQPLSVLGARANAVYQKLGRADATISAEDINTLVLFDAGMLQSHFAKNGMELDWNNALAWATERVLPTIKSNRAYAANINFQRTVNDWERAVQQRQQGGTAPAPQRGGQGTAPRGTQGTAPRPPQGRIPTDRLDRQP